MNFKSHLNKLLLSASMLTIVPKTFAYENSHCPIDKSFIFQYDFIQKQEPVINKALGLFYKNGGNDQNLEFLIRKVSCLSQLSPRPFLPRKLYALSTKYVDQFQRVLSQIPSEEKKRLLDDFKNIKRNNNNGDL